MSLGKGREVRRCDARCHDAIHDKCSCICGGANHGKGLAIAKENSSLIGAALLEKAERKLTGQLHLFSQVQA